MKNKFILIKIIFCIIFISFSAVGTYSYFTMGELCFGKFIDASGNVIADKGSGVILSEIYVYYSSDSTDNQSVILPAGAITITVKNISGKFTPTTIRYSINGGSYTNLELTTQSSGSYIFKIAGFEGGSFKFKLIATQNSDGTNVMTNDFRLTKSSGTLSYDGTNNYLGCYDFTLTNVSVVSN